MSDKYYIWPHRSSELIVRQEWEEVESCIALDMLGKHYAIFYPQEVMFFEIKSNSPELDGLKDLVALTVSDAGDRRFALVSSLFKHVHDEPHYRYLLRPDAFLNGERDYMIHTLLDGAKDDYGITV